jgi:hypothetical protein
MLMQHCRTSDRKHFPLRLLVLRPADAVPPASADRGLNRIRNREKSSWVGAVEPDVARRMDLTGQLSNLCQTLQKLRAA